MSNDPRPLNASLKNPCERWHVTMLPPAGVPLLPAGLALPPDVATFYEHCGGIVIEHEGDPLTILPPAAVKRANPIIVGDDCADDPSFNWFVIAEYSHNYVTLDLNPDTAGRCYDSFWDRHAMRGYCRVLARSFTEFLELMARSPRDTPVYWEGVFADGKSFPGFGDAYDTPGDQPSADDDPVPL